MLSPCPYGILLEVLSVSSHSPKTPNALITLNCLIMHVYPDMDWRSALGEPLQSQMQSSR